MNQYQDMGTMNKQRPRRWISIVIIIAMLVSVVPVSVSAASADEAGLPAAIAAAGNEGTAQEGDVQELSSTLNAAVDIISVTSEEGFVHPGIGATKEVLENMRTQIQNMQEPWYSYYTAMLEADEAKTQFVSSISLDGVTLRTDAYNASNVKDMASRDGSRAYTQALLYYITGNETYRSNALRILRLWQQMDPDKYQYFADSHIHTGIPLYMMIMAAEILRYTSSSEELKWTEEDTEKFTNNVIDPAVRTFLDYNDKFMNQHNYPLYGTLSAYIFKNDKENYEKAVEWFTVNDSAPDKYITGSIYWLYRMVTQNDETGQPVNPYVQAVEMGRDLAHSDGDASNMVALARMLESQGTKVDPVDGTVTTGGDGVSVYEFLDDRILAGTDYFLKKQLGYDIQWTPVRTSAASEYHQAKIYSIVSDEYEGRILYTNLTAWDLYYVYRYKLGYSEEQLEAKAPYFVKAFKTRVAPNFYFSGAGSDEDVVRRFTGADWWIFIPEEAAAESLDSTERTVKDNISHENRYILQLDETYSIIDGSNEIVDETELIRTETEGDISYIGTTASDNGTMFAAYNIFFINRNDTAKVALKIRTDGPAKLELKKERESEPFQTLELPDTNQEWKYVTFDMGQDDVSYGEFTTRTFLAYFNIVGEGTKVDFDYMNIKADETLTPPVFNKITNDSMDLTVFADSTIEYDFSAADSNSGHQISYELQGDDLPGAVLDPSTGAFTWTPSAGQAGSYVSLVAASDGESVTAVRLNINVAADRQGAMDQVSSHYNPDTAYESSSLEHYEEVYATVSGLVNTSTDSEFYAALDELGRAVDGLKLLNPLLSDGSLNFPGRMSSSLQTGFDAYLTDNNSVTFSGDLWSKYFTMDFGLNFRVAPESFALQPRNIWPERMAGAIVYGSDDGDTWIPLTGEAQYSNDLQTLNVLPERLGEAYRYFKVSTTETTNTYGRKSYLLSVGEFRIFGERSEIPTRLESVSIGTDATPLTQHMQGSGASSNVQVPVKKAAEGDTITLDITTKQPLTELTASIAGMDAEVIQQDDQHYTASVTLSPEAAAWNASRNAVFEINYKYLDSRNNGTETAGLPMEGTTDGSVVLVSDTSKRIDVMSKAELTFNRPSDLGAVVGPRLFDGNTSTFVDIRNESSSGNNVFYQFDFGQGGVSLSSVELVPRMTTNLASRMIGIYVAGSSDGVTFKKISPESKFLWDWQGLIVNDDTYYRYIRIVNQNSWFGNLSELQFFGSYVEDRSSVEQPGADRRLDLADLQLSEGEMTPAFDPEVIAYSASVSQDVYQISVTASVYDPSSTLSINGNDAESGIPAVVQLEAGENTVTVQVSGEAGVKEYVLKVVRGEDDSDGDDEEKSSNADLSALKVSPGTLTPAFRPDVKEYSAKVGYGVSSVNVTASVYDDNASLTVNGAEAGSGAIRVPLQIGMNEIKLEVKAEDGTVKEYTLRINREQRPGTVPPPTEPVVTPPAGPPPVITNPPAAAGTDGAVNGGSILYDLKPDSKGQLEIEVKSEDLLKVLKQLKDGKIMIGVKTTSAEAEPSLKKASVQLPVKTLLAELEAGNIEEISFRLGLAAVTVSADELMKTAKGANHLTLLVSAVSPDDLPASVKERIGRGTVYDLQLQIDGKPVTGDNAPVVGAVELDYKMEAGQNPETIVAFSVNEDGALHVIRNSRYDRDGGILTFYAAPLGVYTVLESDVHFNDLSSVSWAGDAILNLAARGIIEGMAPGQYQPEGAVTRAQFVKLLAEALDLKAGTGRSGFTDTVNGAWYEEAVAAAKQAGIIQGYEDGRFGVNEPISRQDIAVMLDRALSYVNAPISSQSSSEYSDEGDISAYAGPAVARLSSAGVLQGLSRGQFAPQEQATRAQAAVMLYRILQNVMEPEM
ncbi:S-layer homology domain-containing protein [Paenibacillus lemnae]|uniref:SLH domain-containing protein n=1 Tax=Paenibacillus lemnae TaxID=1330551 RepID=A0A848M402_PAELE|nr:S-layer homology domain-containing protein [Paenibacillus lemnae]NMO94971.1 hypothetical protein [Paenibacillus lemnae]